MTNFLQWAASIKDITIGWFGVSGSKRSGSKTHLVLNGKAMCGSVFSSKSEYQWCFPNFLMGNPECERCKLIKSNLASYSHAKH
jgi:hypothetical protein